MGFRDIFRSSAGQMKQTTIAHSDCYSPKYQDDSHSQNKACAFCGDGIKRNT